MLPELSLLVTSSAKQNFTFSNKKFEERVNCHQVMMHTQAADGKGLQIWRVDANTEYTVADSQ
jgi:hypothetical protein